MEAYMKPQEYLSDRAKEIFEDILSNIPNKNILISTDSYELSVLASNFASYEENMIILNTDGGTQKTQSGYSQVRAEWTIANKNADYIAKHSDKFGLSPGIRSKMAEVWAKKEKKAQTADDIMNGSNVSVA